MEFRRFLLSVVLISVSTIAFAQTMQKTGVQKSDAEKSFDQLKTLAGSWEGQLTTTPHQAEMDGKAPRVTLRVTSRGNAVVHEMQDMGKADDPTRYDHPVTMLYMDGDRLLLTHYCDAGNRPRMVAKTSPDGKTVDFDFLDVAGGMEYGHMHHVVFTMIDANHHTEDWTYVMPGDKPIHAHFDLQRVQ